MLDSCIIALEPLSYGMEDNKIKSLIATEVLKVLERLEDSKQKDFWETLLTIKNEYSEYSEIIQDRQEDPKPS